MHRVQAAVVGLSARFDVMDIMEKRVKSRFSHRRDVLLELDAAACDGPHSDVPSLLSAMLALPVHPFWLALSSQNHKFFLITIAIVTVSAPRMRVVPSLSWYMTAGAAPFARSSSTMLALPRCDDRTSSLLGAHACCNRHLHCH